MTADLSVTADRGTRVIVTLYGGCMWCGATDTLLTSYAAPRAKACLFRAPCDARNAERIATACDARQLGRRLRDGRIPQIDRYGRRHR